MFVILVIMFICLVINYLFNDIININIKCYDLWLVKYVMIYG